MRNRYDYTINNLLSIPQAAHVLDLSPARVRALAANGQLPASKIGSRWLIEKAAVEARGRRRTPAGRPFAPHNAWAALLLASGEDISDVDPSVRSRLRRALALDGVEKLGPRLARRAESRFFHAHPGEISYVFADPDLVRSGISAAGELDFDLLSGREVDGYLCASKQKKFVSRHALHPTGPEGNVRLRLVPDDAWRFLHHASSAPIAAVALDLAEDPDPRSSKAGKAALHRLERQRSG